eukprot:327310-Pleurochrysis_carterae.AAC.2
MSREGPKGYKRVSGSKVSNAKKSVSIVIYRNVPNSRSNAARGPSRSLGPTLCDHPRLSQACSYFSESLPGNYQPSRRAGSDGKIERQTVGGCEQAQALGLGRAYGVPSGSWLEGSAAATTSESSRT